MNSSKIEVIFWSKHKLLNILICSSPKNLNVLTVPMVCSLTEPSVFLGQRKKYSMYSILFTNQAGENQNIAYFLSTFILKLKFTDSNFLV